ncbi:MAG: hypothetical protein ACTHL8_02515 [Burkholderiaceae bacterium]
MTAAALAPAWPARTRGRAGARLGAAALLHAALLAALVLGLDRVEVARRSLERATQLVEVTLAPLAPLARPVVPIQHPVSPAHPSRPVARAAGPGSPSPMNAAPHAPLAEPAPITALPLATARAPAAVAALPASAPASAPRLALDTQAMRDAIRGAAVAAPTLAQRAQAQTHVGPATSGERLAQGVAAAVKPDCGSAASGFGLLALPVLAYEEAAGKCNN